MEYNKQTHYSITAPATTTTTRKKKWKHKIRSVFLLKILYFYLKRA